MPPKRGKKAASAAPTAPTGPPLDGCRVALSGTFPGFSQPALQKQITGLGGLTSSSITKDTTHLITVQADYDKPSTKVKAAKGQGIHIVSLPWLQDCLSSGSKEDETKYLFNAPSTSAASATAAVTTSAASAAAAVTTSSASQAQSAPQAPQAQSAPPVSQPNGSPSSQPRAKRPRKRAASPSPTASALSAVSAPPAKKKKGAASAANGTDDAKSEAPKSKPERVLGEGQIAKPRDIRVPLDDGCPFVTYGVYIDDQGVIYDASLNQTNASNNNNKFYRIQLLHDGKGAYLTWTRWGRVGERGQDAIVGNGSLADAMSGFEKKFKDKSGLPWAQRGGNPKPGKYAFVERSYEADSDDEEVASAEDGEAPKPKESTLQPAVQDLMKLIFNQQLFAAAMKDLNYDAEKLPLGKLSSATITRGFQTLKDLSALLDDGALATGYGLSVPAAIEHLSNTYYSLIPHDFGRNRPPIIANQLMVKTEIDLLESLSDMKDAAKIMKGDKGDESDIHHLDKQFQGLGLEEMTPLDPATDEFKQLVDYLMNTRGSTHRTNYQVEAVFRIERNGEHDRFDKSPYASMGGSDRRLLWHGSRCTNFGGILSQGLRIAPPEAPVSGYMFGKGIYLADMSSKSANYCCAHMSHNRALLLLCEAELGDPMQELIYAAYDAAETAKSKGRVSTWGKGSTGPTQWKDAECVNSSLKGVKMPDTSVNPGATGVPSASLLYNEYICYDIAQVRLRYLFRVKI